VKPFGSGPFAISGIGQVKSGLHGIMENPDDFHYLIVCDAIEDHVPRMLDQPMYILCTFS